MQKSYGQKKVILMFLLPAFIVYTLFVVVSVIWAGYYSLFDWSGVGEKIFLGINNYKQLFTQDTVCLLYTSSVVGSMDWQRSYAFSLSLILTTKIHCFFSVEEDVTGSKHCSGKVMVFSLCTRDSIMVHSGGPVRQMRQWRSQTTSTVC